VSDKRTVSTDALETLGTIIGPDAKRDAIHLAVIPAVAEDRLSPGDHVQLVGGKAQHAANGHGIGIVDPFLAGAIQPGQRFWLVIYPRVITSLRHVWTHPQLPDETPSVDKSASEAWLRSFCERTDVPSYEYVMKAIEDYGPEEHSLHLDKDATGEIPPEFWTHVEIVLGRKLPHHPTYFSCSC
jgi:hypothetical protein